MVLSLLNKKRSYRPVPTQKVRPKSNDWKVGFFMAKYSFEFKKKVVLDYLNGKVGTVAPNCIRKRFNTYIPHQKITTD